MTNEFLSMWNCFIGSWWLCLWLLPSRLTIILPLVSGKSIMGLFWGLVWSPESITYWIIWSPRPRWVWIIVHGEVILITISKESSWADRWSEWSVVSIIRRTWSEWSVVSITGRTIVISASWVFWSKRVGIGIPTLLSLVQVLVLYQRQRTICNHKAWFPSGYLLRPSVWFSFFS